MPEPEEKRRFFMRARTRSLTRWGAISILAAVAVLGVTMTDDPVVAAPQVSEAVWRGRAEHGLKGYPALSFYQGNGRDIFHFAEPPKPKVAAVKTPVIKVPVKPLPPPKPKPVDRGLKIRGLELRGVAASVDGGGWAIVSGVGKHDTVVKRNDKIREMEVVRIEPEKIILRRGDKEGELKLRKSFDAFVAKAAKSPRSASKVTRKAAPVEKRETRRRSLGVSVRPARGGAGVLVTRVKRFDIDVRKGDIIKSIDGEEVSSMSKAREVLSQAKTKDSITLNILRNGRVVITRVSMVE